MVLYGTMEREREGRRGREEEKGEKEDNERDRAAVGVLIIQQTTQCLAGL